MNFYCLTLFPKMIYGAFNNSITKRARKNGLLSLKCIDIRDYSDDKHKKVDDYPYGGGNGLVIKPDCVYKAYKRASYLIEKKTKDKTKPVRVCYMTPKGRVLDDNMARSLAKEENLILLCGHYEGIDERVLEEIVTDEISIGDYVLTGGELSALVVMDSISRFVDGVLGNDDSAHTDSFSNGLLEYPQYTRPATFHGKSIPEVLLSGHHKNIQDWRFKKSLEITKKNRPDLYDKYLRDNDIEDIEDKKDID